MPISSAAANAIRQLVEDLAAGDYATIAVDGRIGRDMTSSTCRRRAGRSSLAQAPCHSVRDGLYVSLCASSEWRGGCAVRGRCDDGKGSESTGVMIAARKS